MCFLKISVLQILNPSTNDEDDNNDINEDVECASRPVDQLLKLGGITLLLKIIAFSYDWNNGGRSETVRSG